MLNNQKFKDQKQLKKEKKKKQLILFIFSNVDNYSIQRIKNSKNFYIKR